MNIYTQRALFSITLLLSCATVLHAMDNPRFNPEQALVYDLIQANNFDTLQEYLTDGGSAQLPANAMPALFIAIEKGSLPLVQTLVEDGNCHPTTVYHRKSALQWAIICGKLDIIMYFVEIRQINIDNETFNLAILKGNTEIINYLSLAIEDQLRGAQTPAQQRPAPRATIKPAAKPAAKSAPIAKPVAKPAPSVVKPAAPVAKPAATVQKDCMICTDTKSAAEFYKLNCNHEYCKACLNHVVTTNVPASIEQIKCPQCAVAYSEQDLRNLVTDAGIRARLADAQLQRWIATQPNAKHCPTADCGYVYLNEGTRQNITCSKCNKTYCNECTKAHAATTTCAQAAEQSRAATPAERASEQWKQQNTKPCPGCRTAMEKNGGCKHMTCTQCRYEFCWDCLSRWNRETHPSYFECSRGGAPAPAPAYDDYAPAPAYIPAPAAARPLDPDVIRRGDLEITRRFELYGREFSLDALTRITRERFSMSRITQMGAGQFLITVWVPVDQRENATIRLQAIALGIGALCLT